MTGLDNSCLVYFYFTFKKRVIAYESYGDLIVSLSALSVGFTLFSYFCIYNCNECIFPCFEMLT